MTQARTLSSLVGTMARQGVDKPNVHPIIINGDLMVNNHRVVNNTLTGLGDGDEGYNFAGIARKALAIYIDRSYQVLRLLRDDDFTSINQITQSWKASFYNFKVALYHSNYESIEELVHLSSRYLVFLLTP